MAIFKKGNGERGIGNGERGKGNGSTKFNRNCSICRSSSKTMAYKMTGANIDRCQESQKTVAINEFSIFKLFTMQNFVENG